MVILLGITTLAIEIRLNPRIAKEMSLKVKIVELKVIFTTKIGAIIALTATIAAL